MTSHAFVTRARVHASRSKRNHAIARVRPAIKTGNVPNNRVADYRMGSGLTGRNDFPSCYRNAIISSTTARKQAIVKSPRSSLSHREVSGRAFSPRCDLWLVRRGPGGNRFTNTSKIVSIENEEDFMRLTAWFLAK